MNRTDRRGFLRGSLAFAGLGILPGCGLVPLPGRPSAPRRVGYLDFGPPGPVLGAFREGLRDLGYAEGRDLLVEYRSAAGERERLPGLAKELVDLPVEAIVVSTIFPILAASQATSTIPIVAAGANVVAAGLVTNIAHPEGNLTGVTTNSIETVGKWVELLKEAVPALSRLAALLDRSGPSTQAFLQQVERAAEALRVPFVVYDLRDLGQLPAALAAARADRADGALVISGGILGGGNDPRIAGGLLASRLPAIGERRDFAVNGGLLAHGASDLAMARRAAAYVDKILKGARPGDLPIELPTTFDVILNKTTAAALGLAIPPSVLQRATEVIE